VLAVSGPIQRVTSLAIAFALHVLCLLMLFAPLRTISSGASEATRAEVTPVAAPKTVTSSRAETADRNDVVDKHLPGPSALRVYGFQFDLRKIRTRWKDLFPFVTTSLSFQSLARVPRLSGGLIFADPAAVVRPSPPAAPRLSMNESAIQQLVDKTWSRRDRWPHFAEYVKLASRYHPDQGSLPSVLRAYSAQNALQPYTDTSFPDPRRWAMLALAADHQDFIDFVVSYVRQHPSTRAATELLFLLDQLAQGSRDAFVLLLETNPRQQLAWTHEENHQAYELFDSLHEYYADVARQRGLGSIDAVNRQYEDVRLQLLSTVVRLTPNGYRASDALFLIGAIHWRRGNVPDAVEAWRRMMLAAGDEYVDSYTQILEALGHDRTTSDMRGVDARRIQAILDAEHRKWVDFSFDRLARFGYGFDMF
jgi:hypothetical protein